MWLCGCVAVWLYGCVAVRLCGCVAYLVLKGRAEHVKEEVDAVVVDARHALEHDNLGCTQSGVESATSGAVQRERNVRGKGGRARTAAVVRLAEELLLKVALLLQRAKGVVVVLSGGDTGGGCRKRVREREREREQENLYEAMCVCVCVCVCVL